MSVSYDEFSGAFLDKVEEFGFSTDDETLATAMIDGYMKRAISQFKNVCKYDFSTTGDDATRAFTIDVAEGDLQELADIVSEGMLVQWMKPYVYRSSSYENLLSTRDYTVHSPSELIKAIKANYDGVDRKFTNMMREYSYNHGDLTDLHL